MLDLVQEEERVAHLTSMGFEDLFQALDAIDPGNLNDRYAEVSDGYMRLSGIGRRSDDQKVSLDRLDSCLRMLLGERGLLVVAGRMLRIFEAAVLGLAVFGARQPNTRQLLLAQQALARAARLAQDGLRGPVPMDGPATALLARRASTAAAALVHLNAGGGWLTKWSNRGQVAEQGLSQLVEEMAAQDVDPATWQSLSSLFDPANCGHRDMVERLKLCRQLAGWLSCHKVVRDTAGRTRDLAGLVRESLGA